MSSFTVTDASSLGAGTIVAVPYFDGDSLHDVRDAGLLAEAHIRDLMKGGGLRREKYACTPILRDGQAPHVLLINARKRESFDALTLTRCAAAGARYASMHGLERVAVFDRGLLSPFEFGHAGVEGCTRGAYDPALKKTRNRNHTPLETADLVSRRDTGSVHQGGSLGQIVGESISVARDLANLPANDLTPSAFAERVRRQVQEHDVAYDVLSEDNMRELGMGALLGVAAGSHERPRVLVLTYGDPGADMRLALVGKGITFDSGGLSLKTAEGMEHMKSDMAGGAAVVAAVVAIARLNLRNLSVTAYVGATENMPGGHALRPGDVLTALSGETIEVLNTDAEGRLVLADILTYAERQGATHIVDVATLTGGAVVALGHVATLVTGRPSGWVNSVVDAGIGGLERMWAMPLFPEYRTLMESDIADIKNSGGRTASALTAASFLGDFVEEAEWAHLDIAGTSWLPNKTPYLAAGGTGAGVGTLVSLARKLSDDPTA